MIIRLTEATPRNAGAKAAVLGQLIRAGFPVPPGFVIPVAAYRAATAHLDLPRALTSHNPDEARHLVEAQPVPPQLLEELSIALAELGDLPVAVRSSATTEDTPTSSAAGQHDTYLAIQGLPAIATKIQAIWGSLWSPRAIAYRQTTAAPAPAPSSPIPLATPGIAIIIQRQVDAEVAGVLFTPDPRTADNTSVLEASWGLGESVVQGLVTPDTYTQTTTSPLTRHPGIKPTRRDRHTRATPPLTPTAFTPPPPAAPAPPTPPEAEPTAPPAPATSPGPGSATPFGAPAPAASPESGSATPPGPESEPTTLPATLAEPGTPTPVGPAPPTPTSAGGGTVTTEVPLDQRERLCLSDQQVQRIMLLGREVAAHLGGPQDIEFAVENDRVWLLQSRPITAPLGSLEEADQLNSRATSSARADETRGSGVLRGVGGSPGVATGPARVVNGVEDFGRVEKGDILVCRFTDPAWTPLFGLVAGVVTELGGRLSHAAIVAREHRIPAVLGVPNAMTTLPNGNPTKIEGNTGLVRPAPLAEPI